MGKLFFWFTGMQKGVPMSPSAIAAMTPVIVTPPEVFDAVNELLRQTEPNYCGARKLKQKDIVALAKLKLSCGEVPVDFNFKWLDFEDAYRSKGWKVDYDKPAYCESYDAFFLFTHPTITN
jgi:hypothetical protein